MQRVQVALLAGDAAILYGVLPSLSRIVGQLRQSAYRLDDPRFRSVLGIVNSSREGGIA